MPASKPIEVDLEHVPPAVRERVVIFRQLIVLGGRVRALMDAHLAPLGLTTQQAAVLTYASGRPQPPTQGEIARHLGVSHQNVRQLVNALVRKGLVDERPDPADRRSKRIVPTRRVARLFARRNPADFATVAGWLHGVDDREARQLVKLLGRLATSLPKG
ncbi:MAG TPA: MarR family transcriptional regulator [Kofleriaceae bacterium]|jgi:DNA-binding MarR family transcriptional regulator|nr:MarR family transcriptional regulator [Kofleriaceae bacterium]